MNENLVKENTKTLWARVGVSITVSDSEYNSLINAVEAGEVSRADAIVERNIFPRQRKPERLRQSKR